MALPLRRAMTTTPSTLYTLQQFLTYMLLFGPYNPVAREINWWEMMGRGHTGSKG